MKRLRSKVSVAVALAAGASMVLAACGGGGDDSTSNGESASKRNAGMTKMVNPSDKKGGTLRFAISSDFDSMDPGNMYYAFAWNFSRLYTRTLLTWKAQTGSPQITPDLATGLGEHNKDLTEWTYHLKKGIKYADGTEVKAKDVKYAVARSNFAPDVLNKGPVYFKQYLVNPNDYKGPYKDDNLDHFKGVTTPDDYTVVFHLKTPFAEFDNLVTIPQTAPVPPSKDSGKNGGVNYQKHVASTGPYKLDFYKPGKSAHLSRNKYWDPSTDPNRKQLPDEITYQANVNADEVDNRLLNGKIDVDLAGSGVQTAARAKILQDPELKSRTDDPQTTFIWYIPIDMEVKPFDNIHCRRAVEYAINKASTQRAYGGATGGDIATTALPLVIPPGKKYDLYPTPDNKGDVAKAKAELKKCGKPNGFSTKFIFRSDRPKEKQVATSVQEALKRVGIKLELKGYPANTYTNAQLGSPSFMKKNNISMGTYGWGADFPTGFGFASMVYNGDSIKGTGNSNISQLDNPEINKLFDKVVKEPDKAKREAIYAKIDHKVMEQAAIVPLVYVKSLLYRPPNLTNVYVSQAYGMYDYSVLGVK